MTTLFAPLLLLGLIGQSLERYDVKVLLGKSPEQLIEALGKPTVDESGVVAFTTKPFAELLRFSQIKGLTRDTARALLPTFDVRSLSWERIKPAPNVQGLGLYVFDARYVSGKHVRSNFDSPTFMFPGNRPVSRAEFDQAFRGMGLAFPSDLADDKRFGEIPVSCQDSTGKVWTGSFLSYRANNGTTTTTILMGGLGSDPLTLPPGPSQYSAEVLFSANGAVRSVRYRFAADSPAIPGLLAKLGVSASAYKLTPQRDVPNYSDLEAKGAPLEGWKGLVGVDDNGMKTVQLYLPGRSS